MTKKELEIVCDEDELIEYEGHYYEFVGKLGTHFMFCEITNGDAIALSEYTLLSHQVFFVDRTEIQEEHKRYLEAYYGGWI